MASAATLCRRRKALSIEPWVRDILEPLDLVLDSTGLKIFGQGDWCRIKHDRKPRRWRKVHIGLDAKSGMIVSHLMADKEAGDPDQIDDILDQIDRPIGCFMADGAYDGEPVYNAVKRHSPDPAPSVVIPPRKTAVLSSDDEEQQTDHDRHILEIEAKGNGRRSLVETTMGRYKIDHRRPVACPPRRRQAGGAGDCHQGSQPHDEPSQAGLRKGWMSLKSKEKPNLPMTPATTPARSFFFIYFLIRSRPW